MDFSFNNILEKECNYRMNEGNLIYLAPEVIQNNEYSLKSDIWAIGIMILCIINQKNPYQGKNKLELIYEIVSKKQLIYNKD